jgi:hypothetical protein
MAYTQSVNGAGKEDHEPAYAGAGAAIEADKGESTRTGPSTSFFLDCPVWGTLSWHELWRRGHSDL